MRLLPLFAAVFLLFPSCQEASESSSAREAPAPKPSGILASVAAAEFATRLQEDDIKMLVDVRTQEERERDGIIMLEGVEAQHWAFSGEDIQDRIEAIDPEIHLYVYCASGGRSARVGRMLIEKGSREVYNLNGGIGAWKAAGKETTAP